MRGERENSLLDVFAAFRVTDLSGLHGRSSLKCNA